MIYRNVFVKKTGHGKYRMYASSGFNYNGKEMYRMKVVKTTCTEKLKEKIKQFGLSCAQQRASGGGNNGNLL